MNFVVHIRYLCAVISTRNSGKSWIILPSSLSSSSTSTASSSSSSSLYYKQWLQTDRSMDGHTIVQNSRGSTSCKDVSSTWGSIDFFLASQKAFIIKHITTATSNLEPFGAILSSFWQFFGYLKPYDLTRNDTSQKSSSFL